MLGRGKNEHIVLKEAGAHILREIPQVVIFGGAPRDWTCHQKGANEYFQHLKSLDKQQIKHDPKYGLTPYSNSKFHPESFINRMTVPKDLDLLTWSNQGVVEEIIMLLSKKLCFTSPIIKNKTDYIPNVHSVPSIVTNLKMNRLKKYTINGWTYYKVIFTINIDIVQLQTWDHVLPFFNQIPFSSDLMFVSAANVAQEKEGDLYKLSVSDLFHFWHSEYKNELITNRVTHILPTVKRDNVSDNGLQLWYWGIILRIFNKLLNGWTVIGSPFTLAENGFVVYMDDTRESWFDFRSRNFKSKWLHHGKIQSKEGNEYYIQPPEDEEHEKLNDTPVEHRDFFKMTSVLSLYAKHIQNTSIY